MCTSPIQISRRNQVTGQTRIDIVPCGRCEECRSFKRQEFAALSIHQAMVSGSLYFFTLTYDDAHLPVALHDGERLIGFENRSFEREIPIDWWYSPKKDTSKAYNNYYNTSFLHDGLYYTCSLCREDIKNWLKQFRVEYKRDHGEYPSYKYCFFGELGEQRGRPHYHGLIYGASPEVADGLDKLWKKRFGFSYCVPSDYRQLSLEEIGAVSGYVSKYISKGVSSRFAHLLPYIEKPRRICSKNFGEFSEDEFNQLRSYYDGADIRHLSKDLFLQEVSKRRASLKINGNSFPIPLKLKQKLFYENGFSDPSGNGGNCCASRKSISYRQNQRSSVSSLVSSFTRSQHLTLLDRQLRKDSGENSKQVNCWIIRQSLNNEKSSAQFREEIAQKDNLNNLKSQKDGQ